MPITSVTPKLVKAIIRMVEQLKLDYGCDFAYTINGRGFTLAQSNMYGVNHPIPHVQPKKRVDNLTKNRKVTT